MRRERALTLPRLLAALVACGGVACALDRGGLETAGGPSSIPGTTSVGDAAVSTVGSGGGSSGGTDCCDRDSRAHPGVTAFFTAPDTCGSFDYNCSGKEDPEYDKVNCTLGLFACNGSGFDKAPPPCGVIATFDACNLGIGCYTSQNTQAQGCN